MATGHVIAGLEQGLQAAEAKGVGILRRADPEQTFEAALQVMRADADMLGDIGQGRRAVQAILEPGFDEAADLADPGQFGIARRCRIGEAALAGPEAGLPGDLWQGEEVNVLAPRTATGTAWAAVDAGRFYGINKITHRAVVAGHHGLPHLIVCHHEPHGLAPRLTTYLGPPPHGCYPDAAPQFGHRPVQFTLGYARQAPIISNPGLGSERAGP